MRQIIKLKIDLVRNKLKMHHLVTEVLFFYASNASFASRAFLLSSTSFLDVNFISCSFL
jgi:hypothetical protein